MELTEHARNLIAAIQEGGGEFVDRKFIAERLVEKSEDRKSKTLNGADIAVLDLLSANGVIEAVEKSTRAPSGVKLLYRAK